MPYFQRKPIGGHVDALPSYAPVPGLPSRTVAPASVESGAAQAVHPRAIVDRADAVLAREHGVKGTGHAPEHQTIGRSGGQSAPRLGEWNVMLDKLRAIQPSARSHDVAISPPARSAVAGSSSEHDVLIIEPAPVLSPATSVSPGSTTRINITLENEDAHPAHIEFYNSGLIGEDGAQIPAERVSFQPEALTIEPGKSGEVAVTVVVPEKTLRGVYSGLLRASKLDHLHAVLVVHVEAP